MLAAFRRKFRHDRLRPRLVLHLCRRFERADISPLPSSERRSLKAVLKRASAPSGAFLPGRGSRVKKTAHAAEQDRPALMKRREEWFESQLDLDPERLVFIDESVLQRHERSSL